MIYQKSKRIFLVSISRSKNSGIKLSRENLFFEVCKAEIKNSLSSRICKFEKYKFQEEMNMAGTMSEKKFICLWIYNGK